MTFRARMLARFVVAILSWLSPWLSPCSPKLLHGVLCFSSGRFVVFGPPSSHPSSSIPGFLLFYWSACNQDCLGRVRRSVSACAYGSTSISWIEPSVAC